MVSKALIVCDRWGPSIHGGVDDALHLVIRLLQNMGISVHCTALQATEEEEREAEKLGVTLHLPTKTGAFKFREPHRDWLLYHSVHYPKLEELANVKFVFGFNAFTSEAAFQITYKVFPRASCYLINPFDKDDITPLIVGCSKEEVEFRKKIMSDEFKNAKCSFSVRESVYARYRRLYRDSNQQLLSPVVFEEYLSSQIPEKLPILEHEAFQILSIVQEYEFEDPKKLDVIISAINTVAENLDQFDETPPAWKIIGIPPSKEEEIVEKLQRRPALKIMPTYVTTAEEFNRELFSSHLVLIPPSSTSYANLTLAAMCAAIPIVFPRRSHSQEIVNKHIDIMEAKECAIDMDRDPAELAKRITSAIRNNPTALKRAGKIRQHIKEKVAGDLQGVNTAFMTTLTTDMQDASTEMNGTVREAKPTIVQTDRESSTVDHVTGNTESIPSTSSNQEVKEKEQRHREYMLLPTRALRDEESNRVSSGNRKASARRKRGQETANSDGYNPCTPKKGKEIRYDHDEKGARKDTKYSSGEQDVKKSKRRSRDSPFYHLWLKKNKRRRLPRQIEIKVRPDGVIPQEGKNVREVTSAFYSNKLTKDNAVLVGKQLDQRRIGMGLHQIGENSISYIMDFQSLEALESLMGDYSSGSLHRMVKSTLLSESLLDEIGALYLSLGTSIDYEEYLLCKEELADTEGEDIHQLSIEAIEEMNEKIECDVLRERVAVTIGQVKTRGKARDRDNLREMSEEQEKGRASEIDELMKEWIPITNELKQLNTTHCELVFDRVEFFQKTGAIIDQVDIPLDIKQELMMAFQKFLPLGPDRLPLGQDKAGRPEQKLVIEGDVLIEYVKNIVHDFDFPTKGKQDIIEQFQTLVQARSGKKTAKASLTAKHKNLQERIQTIIDDADIPDEQKKVYNQLRQVKRGTPLSNSAMVLLSRDAKESSVYGPKGLTVNQNGHVVVCDIGTDDQPGSVKTVTADTAQILTSVTVHSLPKIFTPQDTKVADNGDYYTADVDNKCIVVSDAKSKVKKEIAMGKLEHPTGVFVDKDRNVFIADYNAQRVIKCNRDGHIISRRDLSQPFSLTMNSENQLIVSCQGDENCIYVLDSNLGILNNFGSDHLHYPWGVTVDNADNIYVADNWQIVKFDRQGKYRETVSVDGIPNYIAVLTDGKIVYSDDNGTVKVIYK